MKFFTVMYCHDRFDRFQRTLRVSLGQGARYEVETSPSSRTVRRSFFVSIFRYILRTVGRGSVFSDRADLDIRYDQLSHAQVRSMIFLRRLTHYASGMLNDSIIHVDNDIYIILRLPFGTGEMELIHAGRNAG